MPTAQRFLDVNCYEEAKNRAHHIYDLFDTVLVAFSGGKDSLVCLHLMREVALERGDTRPIKTIFRDEEVIPPSVLKFVEGYRNLDWIDLRWYALHLGGTKYVLGNTSNHNHWEPGRYRPRPIPEWAITNKTLGIPEDHVVTLEEADWLAARDEPGKVAIVTGLRAAESLTRHAAMCSKIHDNYINGTKNPRVMTAKPIFDWQENDVFRYFYDKGILYCPVYDAQLYAGSALRVSTPLHSDSSKKFGELRAWAPEFHDELVDQYPEMALQERYFKYLDRDAVVKKYSQSWDTIMTWINENYALDSQRRKARKMLASARKRAQRSPNAYPLDYVLKQFMSGIDHKNDILPMSRTEQARRAK
ncbi:MAG: phosphoadenosine phosphosulfate reductase family protein [Verrucomicrobiae bacterium]|nr:phosphoadenosine phosphosulfate reductase family protein [Verrucomicrobiae bacterium]